jgi:hypothetical protein
MPDIPWDFPLAQSVEGRLLEAVANRLRSMGLEGIEDDRIEVRSLAWIADPEELPTPCVIVSPAPEGTPWQEGSNETDRANFAAFISVVLANSRNVQRGLGLQLYWREQIRRKFQNLHPGTFTEYTQTDDAQFIHGHVESGDKFIEAAKRDQRDAQYFLVRMRVKEPRATS